MTTCLEHDPALSDYVDGTLDPERMAEIDRHVRACERCRAVVADLTAIREAARTLEPLTPPAHVWTTVAAALERERRPRPWWRLESGAFAWQPVLATAAIVTLLVGGVWMSWRDVARTGNALSTASHSPVEPVDAQFARAEAHYTSAIADLEAITKTSSTALDSQTVEVVQANLAALDTAIGQSRDALKTEPGSTVAQDSLFEALRRKVQLLQDTVALINEMRKGDPAGTARIVSGTNP